MGRQAVHCSGAILGIFAFSLGKAVAGLAALTVAAILLFLSWWTRKRETVRRKLPLRVKELEKVEDEAYEFIESFEREEELKERPYFGALIFMLAIGLTFLIFPQGAAILAVLILSISDSASTLVGIHLGTVELPHNPDKSLEGSIAFFLTATVIAIFFAAPMGAVLIASLGTLAESLPRIDDNFSVPVTVALVFLLL
ncbi:MAG: diacylglycerol/polyprenol kinase family protein [Candidatus Aenigmatarchaeota archaeon]